MHRPAWLRLLIAVWGLWFTTTVVEPAGLLACEMHSGLRSHAASAQPVATHGMSGDMAAMHHAAAMADMPSTTAVNDVAPASSPKPTHHACCTCLGSCCQAPPVATPVATLALAPLLERASSAAAVTVATRAVTRRPFDLPFANGPPASAQL
jgi:hypothetical protein